MLYINVILKKYMISTVMDTTAYQNTCNKINNIKINTKY
jgi:hypothetical protein